MSEFRPITTMDDLDLQDEGEMKEGYRAGLRGDPEPGSDKSRSWWHGWRNGRVDGGHATIDAAQAELARHYHQRLTAYQLNKVHPLNGHC